MFGSALGQSQPSGGGLFGSSLGTTNQNQQTGGGLFGGLGQSSQNNQQGQQSTGGSLFGGLSQNTQQNQPQQGGLFGNLGQSTQQQSTGLFGASLGQNNQQNQTQQNGGLFSGLGQNNQQQQQQQQNSLFGASQQQSLPALGQSTAMWQPNSAVSPREKSVPDQMAAVLEKWDTGNSNSVFKYYFYNKVDEKMAPYYRPGPNEDPKAWEEALSKKPGPGFIPVLCTGFAQLGERIKNQQRNLAEYNSRLHEINNSLTTMLQSHETKTSIRAMDARRKHIVLRQRCLTLATKVQVLRNRGYAMGGDEEDLRTKLLELEKGVTDPGLGARGEEIWARMVTVQERTRLLKSEIEKSGAEGPDLLDEEMSRRAKKILEDYDRQLIHLKKEMESIQRDYKEWEKEQGPLPKITVR